jgi:hypothetical protein
MYRKFYFVTTLYMFRASTVPIIRSFQLYTWQLVCFMQVMWPLPRTVRFQPDSPRQWPHNLRETYQFSRVQLITPDDGHSRCPKHVEFRDKIKNFGYLMHLVGYLYEDFIVLFIELSSKADCDTLINWAATLRPVRLIISAMFLNIFFCQYRKVLLPFYMFGPLSTQIKFRKLNLLSHVPYIRINLQL